MSHETSKKIECRVATVHFNVTKCTSDNDTNRFSPVTEIPNNEQ